jgi:hypothetical protein
MWQRIKMTISDEFLYGALRRSRQGRFKTCCGRFEQRRSEQALELLARISQGLVILARQRKLADEINVKEPSKRAECSPN